jgi:two-component system chemotaxis response regulator CheY
MINYLTRSGYDDLVQAVDGEEAVLKYRETKPDITVMDITMPNKNGITALEEILKINKEAKIIMVSASGHEDMVIKAIKLGATDFIVKPFKIEKFIEKITKVIGMLPPG